MDEKMPELRPIFLKPDKEDDDILCCCEYIDQRGKHAHLIVLCCECDALDQIVDRCVQCKQPENGDVFNCIQLIMDRCRVPGFYGSGAYRIPLEKIIPCLLVPAMMLLAALHPVLTCLSFIFLFFFVLLAYLLWIKFPRHTKTSFFYRFGISSVWFVYLTFMTFVISSRKILLWEALSLSTMLGFMLVALKKTRKLNAFVERSKNAMLKQNGYVPKIRERGRWCEICVKEKESRSGHCTVCQCCIPHRDHHCIWVDCCIGASNHRWFLLCLILFVVCGLYGSHLTLTTICTPVIVADWFLLPSDCRFLYLDFPTAFSFVTALYSLVVTLLTGCLLGQQILFISQNVTSQEFHKARKTNHVKCNAIAVANVYNEGFLKNWQKFIFGRRWTQFDKSPQLIV